MPMLNRISCLILLLLSSSPILGYPVKLLHLEYNGSQYKKHAFLIGDIHCQEREKSIGGTRVISHSNWFFKGLPNAIHNQNNIPIFWEVSDKQALYSKSNLYIHHQARLLSNSSKQGLNGLSFTPSDTLRKRSPILRKIMFLAIAKPGIAKVKLDHPQFRKKVARSLGSMYLAKSGNMLEKKFYHAAKTQRLPHHIESLMKQNLRWHRQQISRLKQDLAYHPKQIFAEDLVYDLRKYLSQSTADLEFLVNIFAHESEIVLVYAGNGHIRRLQNFFYKLGFKASFEIENGDFLSKSAFEAFALDLKRSSANKSTLLQKSPFITI